MANIVVDHRGAHPVTVMLELFMEITKMEDKTIIIAMRDQKIWQMANKQFIMDSGTIRRYPAEE